MKRLRPSLTALMGMVGLAALGLAGLRSGSPLLFKASYAVTLLALALAVVVAWFRSGGRRASWVGFAVFGWAYFLTGFVFLPGPESVGGIPLPDSDFPIASLMGRLAEAIHPDPPQALDQYPPGLGCVFFYVKEKAATTGIGHLTLVWASGIAGGIIARAIAWFRRPGGRGPEQVQPFDPI
jgi:hypothetical protein